MTVLLYEDDFTAVDFTAKVLSCEPAGDRWAVTLDRTAFFPEGGGQGCDLGTLNGLAVTDVQNRAGTVVHTVAGPLPAGETVTGQVDWDRRLAMSQQHSGEHILTGLIHRRWGYDNVGFHIGTEAVTVDFSGPLTPEQVRWAELEANRVVWRDQPVHAWYPDPETLAALPYRSKKALTGPIRIVEIEGVDICACCGTHVKTTGQVGQIKVLTMQNYKGGTRLGILCGIRALEEENRLLEEDRAVSHALSAPSGELAEAVLRLQKERDGLKSRTDDLARQLFEVAAARETGAVRVVLSPALPPAMLRKCCGELARGARLAAVLLPREGGLSYALCSLTEDVRPAAKALNEAFGGKGGGPRDMVQGVLDPADPEAVRRLLENLT